VAVWLRRPRYGALVAGRERIYLDRFWNEFALHPERFDEATRRHYATLYAVPSAIRAVFAQFVAFGKDALDSKTYLAKGKLNTPVLAPGGEAAFGAMMATVMRCVRTDVQEAIVPDSGHWIMEENPSATTILVTNFLKSNGVMTVVTTA
jgi:pimeloyl-ACP methyl ester carboxylesterase